MNFTEEAAEVIILLLKKVNLENSLQEQTINHSTQIFTPLILFSRIGEIKCQEDNKKQLEGHEGILDQSTGEMGALLDLIKAQGFRWKTISGQIKNK